MSTHSKRRVGFVGYGMLGKSLVNMILDDARAREMMEIAFVVDLFAPDNVLKDARLPEEVKIKDLNGWEGKGADLIVEVAHPDVSKKWGAVFLEKCDYMLASTTAFADHETEASLRKAAYGGGGKHGIYLTAGALFGSLDIQRMSAMGKVGSLRVVMKKHPLSLYPVEGTEEFAKNERAKEAGAGPVVLFDGSVRQVALVFPRNVNTLCTAAIATWSSPALGMDGCTAQLVADASLQSMIIEMRIEGIRNAKGECLVLNVNRESPSTAGEVTSPATVSSFLASLLHVAGSPPRGPGIHFA